MEGLVAKYPTDDEAQILYALVLNATAMPTDKTFANQLKAASLLEPLVKKYPNHPGVVHYLIHTYGYTELAEKGLPAARVYAGIAPSVPHALHMPSHIFTRLGLWQESIESNRDSAAAAKEHNSTFEQLHALGRRMYGGDPARVDELVFGPAPATGGMLDTDLLDEGDYWIVESTVPDGFVGSDPILVELNLDPSKTCIWYSDGLIECEPNEDEEDLSLTIVIVDNTPEGEPPTGGVGGAVGTPRPRATLPATDTLVLSPLAFPRRPYHQLVKDYKLVSDANVNIEYAYAGASDQATIAAVIVGVEDAQRAAAAAGV